MTKDNYMALADIQEIWTNKQKPYIGQTFATKQELSELKGPTYNPQTRTITYPTTSAVTYDAANRKIVIPTAGV